MPWQCADAYYVWLSEIMLQQTQVVTVIPYFQRFVAAFPTVNALADAREDEVLAHWSGLGYYARGRNLHKAAQIIASVYGGQFPRHFDQIVALPGIGRSTASAICALAYRDRRAILDGNVRRVLARYCGISGSPSVKSVEARLWEIAESLLPESSVDVYTQAMMDMGATLCTRSKPKCGLCPVSVDCVAKRTGRVALLPTPRAKKTVPERHAVFLLAEHEGAVLLEKRDSSGLWGGLWCLPQFSDEAELGIWCKEQGWAHVAFLALTPFTHVFTHFKLHIRPLRLAAPDRFAPGNAVWMDRQDALAAAIPTPVRAVLNQKLP